MTHFPVTATNNPKLIPADVSRSFGDSFSDHMFLMEYDSGRGWHSGRIVPFGSVAMHPSSSALQYGQAIFDGSKGFRWANGDIHLFRPQAHVARLNNSAKRMCMPAVPCDQVMNAIVQLVALDQRWVPGERGTAIYIRQTMIGTEGLMSVRPSASYLYMAFLSPVGSYYAEGADPISILASERYVRAASNGGIGSAKAGANYGASLKAAEEAREQGFTQVLWLDSIHRKYLEEVGTMNIMVRLSDEIVTPPLSDSILPGVTRDSILTILRDWGMSVSERPISIDELMAAGRIGRLEEIWGVGTAAVVSPIGRLSYRGEEITVNGGQPGELTKRLYSTITALQYGDEPDSRGWTLPVPI